MARKNLKNSMRGDSTMIVAHKESKIGKFKGYDDYADDYDNAFSGRKTNRYSQERRAARKYKKDLIEQHNAMEDEGFGYDEY